VPATGNKSRKARLHEYLAQKRVTRFGEPEWLDLLASLAPISENYLRRLLGDAGVTVEPPFGGIRQKTFDELEQSLIDMERVYAEARDTGDRAREQYCRKMVIQAKDHARLASRNPKAAAERKAEKEEMVQWMLVWLENPGVFPTWVQLRKKRIQ
jgi:hypothetical protein